MHIDTLTYDGEWKPIKEKIADKAKACIVFAFGDSDILRLEAVFESLKRLYPGAHIVGASSAGHILGHRIAAAPVVATAVQFDKSAVRTASADFAPGDDVAAIATSLIAQLDREDLKHVFVLSDGLHLNGSDLVRGLTAYSGHFSVTGGMAGDGARFQETFVLSDAPAKTRRIAAVGFYGADLVISHGCHAGWREFGSDRMITKSQGNVLHELDHQPALDLYKTYLGEFADDLPNSGMRFPLSIRRQGGEPEVIRTLLAIDEKNKSITFAGDVPEGYLARLMKPDVDMLIDGAKLAAQQITQVPGGQALGLVVSCMGRKIVMSQLVEEELDALEAVLGDQVELTGFYSYGEIAPFANRRDQCQLHNQTMTLTAIYEG